MNATRKVDINLLKTMPLPDWNDDTSKASRGKLLFIGGSRRLPGAVILAARAALRIGCGTVRVAVPESVALQIGIAVPELMVLPLPETSQGTISASAASQLLKEQMKACAAIVLGPGIDEDKETEKAVRKLLAKAPLPMVVDAQALFGYDVKQKPTAPRILTPHEDEFKALTDGKEVDMTAPESIANEFARQSNTVLVLKGQNTFIATPDGSIFKNEAGNRALGTAGSGDTLAGIIGGLLAQGMEPTTAAVWGVYFHAVTGEAVSEEVGEDGAMASDFIDRLPAIQRRLRQATSNKDDKSKRGGSARATINYSPLSEKPLSEHNSSSGRQPLPNTTNIDLDVQMFDDGRLSKGTQGSLTVPTETWVAEIFSPPYLYIDGQRRPIIISLSYTKPIDYQFESLIGGQRFYLLHSNCQYNIHLSGLPNRCLTRRKSKLVLIKLGSSTHGWDGGQRLINLPFEGLLSSTTLQFTTPEAQRALIVPAFYMLFYIDCMGKPSVAQMIRFDDQAQKP